MPSDKRQRQRQNSQSRAAAARAAQARSRNRRRGLVAGVAILAIVVLIALLIRGSTGTKSKSAASTTTVAHTATTAAASSPPVTFGTVDCPSPDGSAPRKTVFAAPPKKCIVDGKTYTATMTTDVGAIVIALNTASTPMTVNNFVFLARYHFYDGITFHRVIPGFVDQGGDPNGTGSGGPGYQFADELPKAGAYAVGSLAMANSGPNTNGSQFFIIVGHQGVILPPQYSLFGTITQGIDVAHAIEADGTTAGTPKVVHKIVSVTIAET
ncbi:MAG: peptidylprolyl isomerase [Acidimicrobiales bacterium]